MMTKELKSCYVLTKMLEEGMNEIDYSKLVLNMIHDVLELKQKHELDLEDSWVELCLNNSWYDYLIKDLHDICNVVVDILNNKELSRCVQLQPETYGIHIELNWKEGR